MAKKLSGLGRGIDAIFLDNTTEEEKEGGTATLRLSQLEANSAQPRKRFENEALSQLADSIATHGVLQPILVRPLPGDRYQILAGERRYRAAKMAGLDEVPVMIVEVGEEEAAQIALIENVQREDLNPLEEANAYRMLAEEYRMTQEEIAARIGKSRPAIANALRLLELPADVQPLVISGELSAGHARALLGLADKAKLSSLARTVCEKMLSVRDTEALVRRQNRTAAEEETLPPAVVDYAKVLEGRLMNELGRRVRIDESGSKKAITFFYEDNADLEEFLKKLCGNAFFEEEI